METPTTRSTHRDVQTQEAKSLPIIDASPLVTKNPNQQDLDRTVQAIREACCNWGFFYIKNHGVSVDIQKRAEDSCKEFFALPLEKKQEITINSNEKTYRGYFGMGIEHTNNQPDLKEGMNFGVELSPNDPRVLAGRPLHGPNVWPSTVPDMKPALTEYMNNLEQLGHAILRGVSLSLNLPPDYFKENYLKESNYRLITLNYPPDLKASKEPRWGTGEHSDYGLLTILRQDNSGGLQVKSVNQEWIEATPIDNAFVVNLGDMLQTITNGLYVSTPHRARNIYTGKDRFSCPFFLDPSWDAEIKPLPSSLIDRQKIIDASGMRRSPNLKPNCYIGTYGEYAVKKFSTNFPVNNANKLHALQGSRAFQYATRAFSVLRNLKL